ncbi:hypothetical protein [Rhodococcoides fascians]|uniref:hypothetical protein n=1 Tax=Rhodococcoides fascians TaxID=1828 RepID=UPI000A7F7B7F|nr:hypothetical protein [Rhodococcus fascians]
MTPDELEMACEWSDYRKSYGVAAETLDVEHKAFVAGWQAARGNSHEPGPVR